jgi:hypothetical protein
MISLFKHLYNSLRVFVEFKEGVIIDLKEVHIVQKKAKNLNSNKISKYRKKNPIIR